MRVDRTAEYGEYEFECENDLDKETRTWGYTCSKASDSALIIGNESEGGGSNNGGCGEPHYI